MIWLLWSVLIVVALVVGFFIVASIAGRSIPPDHVASSTLRIAKPIDVVWRTISEIPGHQQWTGVDRLERLPDRDGHEVWRQFQGRNSFVLETTESRPPTRLVRTIADDHAFFSGSWTYDLVPDGDAATRLTITERGHVPGAVPRFFMKHLMGYHLYLNKHLRGLAKELGEPSPRIENSMP
jgi:uncharacterized protein YndB with AHSA1/START domain